jgi:hypothetical protein
MNLKKAIEELYAEKVRLDRVIASLEELRLPTSSSVAPTSRKRRGRKSMNGRERQDVSERMRKYWANRRKQQKQAPGH